MAMSLRGRNLLKEVDFTKEEFLSFVELGERLRAERRTHHDRPRLAGKNIALIFEKASTRTRCAFEVAAYDEGAHVTYLGPEGSQIGHKESIKDTARVLGRMFDGIEYRGFAQESVELLGKYAGVPVWNGLTDEWHPTQMLADLMTMRDHSPKPLESVTCCYLGDTRNNTASSLLVTGALVGMDMRLGGPRELWPSEAVRSAADALASGSGARLKVTDDVDEAVDGADFVYTDVWLSMGEPADRWAERIKLLLPYQVNTDVMKSTGNPDARFMHCLPALHNRDTEVGRQLYKSHGIDALEVTEEVFESPGSVVFDEAENRMHTIKAILVATLAG
ncbi:MAG: ornithine carbamoyltransferase [Acidimicrobiales bacterium]